MFCDTVVPFAQDIRSSFCFFEIFNFNLFLLRCWIHLDRLAIFLHSSPDIVVVKFCILFFVNSFVKKKIADVDLSSEVPMVVALDKNMYKSPGQVRSIFIVPGCTMMQGIGCPGPHV